MTFSHQTERAKLRAAPHENVDQEGGHDHDKTEKEMSFEIVRCLYFFFEIAIWHQNLLSKQPLNFSHEKALLRADLCVKHNFSKSGTE